MQTAIFFLLIDAKVNGKDFVCKLLQVKKETVRIADKNDIYYLFICFVKNANFDNEYKNLNRKKKKIKK